MRISGSIFSLLLVFGSLQPMKGQDTLRTYGPTLGLDLARFVYYFSDPAIYGAEASVDVELFNRFYPVFELGYGNLSDSISTSDYNSQGIYGRLGLDYNVLPPKDRSVHHSISLGLRYGTAVFQHKASNILVPSDYWGDFLIDDYENTLNAHWLEIAGGLRAEVLPNLFLGWSVRYRILLNPDLDPQVSPLLIPGYGKGTENRTIGISYTLAYKIPLFKK